MLKLIKKNSYFYIAYLVFFVIASIILLMYSKKEIHLYTNGFHNEIFDYFFKYITYLGNGVAMAILVVVLLFVKYRYAIILLISTLSITAIVQLFKRHILPDIVRPILYFHNQESLHLVDGVHMNTAHSFPSGHTATAFTMFLFLAFISKNNYVKLLCFVAALLVGYSRVYLSQHFLSDIHVGSFIAVVITTLVYLWVNKWKNPKLDLAILRNKIIS